MDVVEVNGKMYPKEDVEKAQKIIMEVYEVVLNTLEAIATSIYTFIKTLTERGYTEEQALEYLNTIVQHE